jgi:hypothetical protein
MPRPSDLLITAPGERFLQHHLSIAAGTAQSHTVPPAALCGAGPGGLARYGQEFADTAAGRGVAPGFVGPAAFGGVLDQLSFVLEAVSQPGPYSLVVKNFGQRR